MLLGDPATFSAAVSREADGLVVRMLRSSNGTSLAVSTDKRNYEFGLVPSYGGSAPYLIRIAGEERQTTLRPVPASPTPQEPETHKYKLSGKRELRPASIRDDGMRTFIEWGEAQAMPAIFAISDSGEEVTVNGYMRGDAFVIDGLPDELVFRIDNDVAKARRSRRK